MKNHNFEKVGDILKRMIKKGYLLKVLKNGSTDAYHKTSTVFIRDLLSLL